MSFEEDFGLATCGGRKNVREAWGFKFKKEDDENDTIPDLNNIGHRTTK